MSLDNCEKLTDQGLAGPGVAGVAGLIVRIPSLLRKMVSIEIVCHRGTSTSQREVANRQMKAIVSQTYEGQNVFTTQSLSLGKMGRLMMHYLLKIARYLINKIADL